MKKPGWKPKKGVLEPKLKSAESDALLGGITTPAPAADVAIQGGDYNTAQGPAQDQPQGSAQNVRPDSGSNAHQSHHQRAEQALPVGSAISTETPGDVTIYDDAGNAIDLNANPRIYVRPLWKNIIHWAAFASCLLFDVSVIGQGLYTHMVALKPQTISQVKHELVAYALTLGVNIFVLPSIVFEAFKVEVRDNCLIVSNLIKRTVIPWSDVKWVFDPMFLKFAIIRTPKFFQLINKRDIKHFDELLHTIKLKAGLPTK